MITIVYKPIHWSSTQLGTFCNLRSSRNAFAFEINTLTYWILDTEYRLAVFLSCLSRVLYVDRKCYNTDSGLTTVAVIFVFF